MSRLLLEDNESIISDINIPMDELRNSVIMITGATGMIGSAIVRALSAADTGLNIRIIALGRDLEKAKLLIDPYGVEFIRQDICEPLAVDVDVDYIFHCAAITKSADMVSKPADVIATSVDGTRNMLELARKRHCKSFVYLSSMEVYGQTELSEVSEMDLGNLDLSNPRSSYPESKRFCEMLCAAYAAQYGIPVKIARLAQTFGAGTPRDDTRVFAQFARSVIAGNNIVLHTEGNSRGNYCYVADAVRGLLTVLLKGNVGEAYNIANPDTSVTIREMAELVANKVCGGSIKVVVDVPEDIQKRGYAPDVGYRLNTDKLKALGWTPMYGLDEMYQRMLAEWQEN